MANVLFLVVNDDELLTMPDSTSRSINLTGSSFTEPGLRAWMASEYGITAGSIRSAFTMLRALGWAVLMVFPTDPVTEDVAAMIKDRAARWRGGA